MLGCRNCRCQSDDKNSNSHTDRETQLECRHHLWPVPAETESVEQRRRKEEGGRGERRRNEREITLSLYFKREVSCYIIYREVSPIVVIIIVAVDSTQ